jgi:hypothetical protein
MSAGTSSHVRFRLGALGKVVADLVEVDVLEVAGGPVGRKRLGEEGAQGVEAELADPRVLLLDVADVADGAFAEAAAGVEVVFDIVFEVPGGLVDAGHGTGGGFLDGGGGERVAVSNLAHSVSSGSKLNVRRPIQAEAAASSFFTQS